ncbi:MAG: hypothetical protein E6Q97_13535 [Desulfurellales bacterium]|nr:MAG: hypothetical protein E6Q97_13535 [Desulfurellales bacterium]
MSTTSSTPTPPNGQTNPPVPDEPGVVVNGEKLTAAADIEFCLNVRAPAGMSRDDLVARFPTALQPSLRAVAYDTEEGNPTAGAQAELPIRNLRELNAYLPTVLELPTDIEVWLAVAVGSSATLVARADLPARAAANPRAEFQYDTRRAPLVARMFAAMHDFSMHLLLKFGGLLAESRREAAPTAPPEG